MWRCSDELKAEAEKIHLSGKEMARHYIGTDSATSSFFQWWSHTLLVVGGCSLDRFFLKYVILKKFFKICLPDRKSDSAPGPWFLLHPQKSYI
jgi:hypothetical protein